MRQRYPAFNASLFQQRVFDPHWSSRTLKSRIDHIADALYQGLPMTYLQSLAILTPLAAGFEGFSGLFLPAYVEKYGRDEPIPSLQALAQMTRFCSAEFAIRTFLEDNPKDTLAQMLTWSLATDEHLRRLACEGCRPRLPWARVLKVFQHHPQSVLPLLQNLKADNSVYVRKSVANHLNDISKDCPEWVIKVAQNWWGQHPHSDWVIKRGCRTLLKENHPAALSLFGFLAPNHVHLQDFYVDETVTFGHNLHFSFALNAGNVPLGKLRIEYAIDLLKARGHWSRKWFAVSESFITASHKAINRQHAFKPLSVRRYYPGLHRLIIRVNGVEQACGDFVLGTW
jgi:3-methyladenine DNA glycosylase AlkC